MKEAPAVAGTVLLAVTLLGLAHWLLPPRPRHPVVVEDGWRYYRDARRGGVRVLEGVARDRTGRFLPHVRIVFHTAGGGRAVTLEGLGPHEARRFEDPFVEFPDWGGDDRAEVMDVEVYE